MSSTYERRRPRRHGMGLSLVAFALLLGGCQGRSIAPSMSPDAAESESFGLRGRVTARFVGGSGCPVGCTTERPLIPGLLQTIEIRSVDEKALPDLRFESTDVKVLEIEPGQTIEGGKATAEIRVPHGSLTS